MTTTSCELLFNAITSRNKGRRIVGTDVKRTYQTSAESIGPTRVHVAILFLKYFRLDRLKFDLHNKTALILHSIPMQFVLDQFLL
jgi:hypothetical protein